MNNQFEADFKHRPGPCCGVKVYACSKKSKPGKLPNFYS